MKTDTRERAIRAMAASLVAGDFTMAELGRLGKALCSDVSFSKSLGCVILRVHEELLGSCPPPKSQVRRRSADVEEGDHLEEILDVLRRRKTSKRQILERMKEVSDRPLQVDSSLTLRGIVDAFLNTVSPEGVSRFLQELGIREQTSDPFLRGILKRGLRAPR